MKKSFFILVFHFVSIIFLSSFLYSATENVSLSVSNQIFNKENFSKEFSVDFGLNEYKDLVTSYENLMNSKITKIDVMENKNNSNIYLIIYIKDGYIIRKLGSSVKALDIDINKVFTKNEFTNELNIDENLKFYKKSILTYEKILNTKINKIEVMENTTTSDMFLIVSIRDGYIIRKLAPNTDSLNAKIESFKIENMFSNDFIKIKVFEMSKTF